MKASNQSKNQKRKFKRLLRTYASESISSSMSGYESRKLILCESKLEAFVNNLLKGAAE